MQRLFVAIRPPPTVRDLLLGTMGGIGGARWQSDEQLHLTIRFIGEVDRHAARDIHAALGAVRHPRFQLAISGIGAFERRGAPSAVWAGVAPHQALKALHRSVTQALVRVGIPPEQRSYHPHITLARLKRSSRTLGGLVEESGGLTSPPFEVDRFVLFESRLTPEGPVYTPLEYYPLG